MAPFASLKQNAWAHTAAGTKALGGSEKVKEWENATNYNNLPEKKTSEVKSKKAQRMRRTSRAR